MRVLQMGSRGRESESESARAEERGGTREAGEEAVRYGFEELGEERLFSTILVDNERSQAVAQRLGFVWVETKTLSHFPQEPHGIWALDRESWAQD